jgi:hypothetical protein
MRGEPVRSAALALALFGCSCSSLDHRGVVMVDTKTDEPASICWYGGLDDPNAVPPNETYVALAAWDDGRLVCRGYGFEGELGRTTVEPRRVGDARHLIAAAIERVPPEARSGGADGKPVLVISVLSDGRLLQFAPHNIGPEGPERDALKALDSALEALIPENCRHSNPPAPNFDLLIPASVRFKKSAVRVNR